jgi:Brp/Blh family beta-carotene 15,15'-monooxygenase
MTKVNKHQIYFIIFSVIIILLSTISDILMTNKSEVKSNVSIIMIISMSLIGTMGVAHGALDGKIIWKHSVRTSTRLKLYLLYMLFTSSGALIWFIYPFGGLVLLLVMSSVHFGVSDLKFINEINFASKVYWGVVMAFLPLVFKPNLVNSLFFDLTQVRIQPEIFDAINIIVLVCIICFSSSLYKIAQERKNKGKTILELKLLGAEMMLLICLAYFLNPLTWFSIYFCGLHGIRALMDNDFRMFPDILWLTLFTAPISIMIFLFKWEYTLNSLLVIFPILASLTIAHMLLPKLRKIVKT